MRLNSCVRALRSFQNQPETEEKAREGRNLFCKSGKTEGPGVLKSSLDVYLYRALHSRAFLSNDCLHSCQAFFSFVSSRYMT